MTELEYKLWSEEEIARWRMVGMFAVTIGLLLAVVLALVVWRGSRWQPRAEMVNVYRIELVKAAESHAVAPIDADESD